MKSSFEVCHREAPRDTDKCPSHTQTHTQQHTRQKNIRSKTLKEVSPDTIKIFKIMTSVMFRDGFRQEIDEEVFNQMYEILHQTRVEEQRMPERLNRIRDDGTYDKGPDDPKYFSKYYQKNLSRPFKCPDCGRTISSKSNLSKHQKTNVCINNRCSR